MAEKDMSKKQLTKEWVTIMLHEAPQTNDQLIEIGCKIMVLGHEYEEFLSIIDEMIDEKSIVIGVNNNYSLTPKGRFNLRKHVYVPITTLLENKILYEQFVFYAKGQCDAKYLDNFNEITEDDQIKKIRYYARKNYHTIANILYHAIPFIVNSAIKSNAT